jgi:hypothetical protein
MMREAGKGHVKAVQRQSVTACIIAAPVSHSASGR